MSERQLQIKLLSRSGELLNVVNCFAGQVSVFRATAASDLMPYYRALAGIPGPERFSITFNSRPYSPQENILIGFGENFSLSEGSQSVREFLLTHQVPDSAVDSMLMSYGLPDRADKTCSSLTPHEERVLRILAATYSTDKALVINDPFEPIINQWRERIAELLVTYARSKQEVVIVPVLSHRPECWIDNEFIARIQVGENVQKTIGFGSSATDINTVLNQLRQEYHSGATSRPTLSIGGAGMLGGVLSEATSLGAKEGPHSTVDAVSGTAQDTAATHTPSPWTIGIIGSSVAAAILVGIAVGTGILRTRGTETATDTVALVHESSSENSETKGIPSTAVPLLPSPLPTVNVAQTLPEVAPTIPQVLSTPPQAQEQAEKDIKQYVLDLYPPAIKRSVLETFEGAPSSDGEAVRKSVMRAPRVSENQAEPAKASDKQRRETNAAAAGLLSMLQSASDTGEGLPEEVRNTNTNSIQQPEMENLSPEQRRELIRQKFLEAIQKAADQKR